MSDKRRRIHNQPGMKPRRRVLRNHGTPAEAVLWKMLRRRQLAGRTFRRQHSVGRYVLDFYCPAERLAVELDGAVHEDPLRHAYDGERAAFLKAQGIRVVHFKNEQVFGQPDTVLAAIRAHFQDREAP